MSHKSEVSSEEAVTDVKQYLLETSVGKFKLEKISVKPILNFFQIFKSKIKNMP